MEEALNGLKLFYYYNEEVTCPLYTDVMMTAKFYGGDWVNHFNKKQTETSFKCRIEEFDNTPHADKLNQSYTHCTCHKPIELTLS